MLPKGLLVYVYPELAVVIRMMLNIRIRVRELLVIPCMLYKRTILRKYTCVVRNLLNLICVLCNLSRKVLFCLDVTTDCILVISTCHSEISIWRISFKSLKWICFDVTVFPCSGVGFMLPMVLLENKRVKLNLTQTSTHVKADMSTTYMM